MPTSWMPKPSRAVNGLVAELAPLAFVFFKSSFLGRCRDVGIPGEPGSFLTIIFGLAMVFRLIERCQFIRACRL